MVHSDRRTFIKTSVFLGLTASLWDRWGSTNDQPQAGQSADAAVQLNQRAILLGLPGTKGRSQPPGLQGCQRDLALMQAVLEQRCGFGADAISQHVIDTPLSSLSTVLPSELERETHLLLYVSGIGGFSSPETLAARPTWEQALPFTALYCPMLSENGDRQNWLFLQTLFSRLQGLKPKRLTVLLDCGFSSEPEQLSGNLRNRSLPLTATELPPQEETPSSKKVNWNNWTLISAAAPGQTAVEGVINEEWCGLFTAALTAALWESSPSQVQAQFWQQSRQLLVPRLGDRQVPQWKAPAKLALMPGDFAEEGEFKVTQVLNNGELKGEFLSPLTPTMLHSYYQLGTSPDLNSDSLEPAPVWQVIRENRTGAKLQPVLPEPVESVATENKVNKPPAIVNSPGVGSVLRERYRAIPQTLGLTVALAESLERIERVDATTALTALASVTQVINAGEGAADCVFGKLAEHRYTLFLEGGYPLPPLSPSEASGAVKTVVGTLESSLNQLLALKWLRTLSNDRTSQLPLQLSLRQLPLGDSPLSRELYRWRSSQWGQPGNPTMKPVAQTPLPSPPEFLPQVSPELSLQYQLDNGMSQELYGLFVGVDNQNQPMVGLFADQSQSPPQSSILIPSSDGQRWVIPTQTGIAQWFLIASQRPLTQTLEFIQQQNSANTTTPFGLISVKSLLPIVTTLMTDLVFPPETLPQQFEENYLLDTKTWLTLPIMYQVR